MRIVARFAVSKSGAVALEYALIATIISLAIITAAFGVGGKLGEMFSGVAGHFN